MFISVYISVYLVSSGHVCTFKHYLCAYKCLEKEKLQDNLTCVKCFIWVKLRLHYSQIYFRIFWNMYLIKEFSK